jgi:hypothetical protein
MSRAGGSVSRFSLVSVVVLGALLAASASQAGAAVTIGETFTPTESFGGAGTFIQTGSPGDSYVVPSDGVITSWSFQAPSDETPPMKLKMFRSAGGDDYTTVGESQLVLPAADVLNTFLTRIPVKAGDVPGHFYTGPDTTVFRHAAGFFAEFNLGPLGNPDADAPPGTTLTYTPDPGDQIDLSAVLEPDEDHDGFGDETQDKCLGTPGPFNGCPSTFLLDKVKQKRGAAKITVNLTVFGAGTVAVGSPGDPALASASAKKLKAKTTTETVTGKHGVFFKLKLTKAAAKKLSRLGKLKVKVEAVYTPPGGPPATLVAKKKLKS